MRISWIGFLGSWFVALATPLFAHATPELGATHTVLNAGAIEGNEKNRDVRIDELRLDLGHRFRERLEFLTQLSCYRPDGERDGESVSTGAVGAAFALRWYLLGEHRFRLYADWGFGLMMGLDPFPPAGTRHNGTPHFALGLRTSVSPRYDVHIEARHRHMSNGRGLVADNPSFDGLGGFVGISYHCGFRSPKPPVRSTQPFSGEGTRYRVEFIVEDLRESDSPGGRVAVDRALTGDGTIRILASFHGAELADDLIWTAEGYLYREASFMRLAIGYSRQEFHVFSSDRISLQVEHIMDDISVLQLLAGLEERSHDKNILFGGAMFTITPLASLSLRSGITFAQDEGDVFSSIDNLNDGGFHWGVEWSPSPLARLGLSLTIDERIAFDERSIGIRYRSSRTGDLGGQFRAGEFLPLR